MAHGLLKSAVVLGATGAAMIAAWSHATAWRPDPARYPLQGIDLGEAPPPVEWSVVRAEGSDFAYLVATSGADRRDASFQTNWAALPDAGMRRGAVHIYSLCQSGIAQADAFNTVVPRTDDALPAAVDISFRDDCTARPDRAALIADLTRFLDRVETHTGAPVLLRVSRAVESAYTLTASLRRPVWAIANLIAPDYAARPWRLWRASDVRRIDGIEGPVNWDVVAP